MKQLKKFKELGWINESSKSDLEEIHRIMRENNMINQFFPSKVYSDGSIDVEGNAMINYRGYGRIGGNQGNKLTELPIKFRSVSGNFVMHHAITSLKNFPEYVGGNLYLSDNKITSLEGCPKYVGGHVILNSNKLTSLIGLPDLIHGNLFCADNYLTDLIGSPNRIMGTFDVASNDLRSLEGCPQYIDSDFIISDNENLFDPQHLDDLNLRGDFKSTNTPLDQIVRLFDSFAHFKSSLDYRYIVNDEIILPQFMRAYMSVHKNKFSSYKIRN